MPFRTLLTAIKSGGLFLSAISWGIMEAKFLPAPGKIIFLCIAMFVDLMTGLLKAWKLGRFTTSSGLKQTAIKIGTYACIIVAVYVLANILGDMTFDKVNYTFFVTGTVGFLTFIEIYSIFENIYEMDNRSVLSIYLCGPVLRWLKGNLKKYGPKQNVDIDSDANNCP